MASVVLVSETAALRFNLNGRERRRSNVVHSFDNEDLFMAIQPVLVALAVALTPVIAA